MKGQILDFSIQTSSGLISGDDNSRYEFEFKSWKDASPPQKGLKVDFTIDSNGKAVDIYLVAVKKSNYFTEPLKPDEEKYNILDWSKKCFINYVNFEGRARRKEYWFFILMTCIVSAILKAGGNYVYINGLNSDAIIRIVSDNALSNLWSLIVILPMLAVGTRRLHDIGRSGWWQLLFLTGFGIIILIIFFTMDTKQEDNQWGKPARKILSTEKL